MRLACDTGGTFTDLIIEGDDGLLRIFKAPTTVGDPVRGVLDAVALAAVERGVSIERLLADADAFIHGTTHAINAIVTGRTARTAFLTTRGHRDMLVLREGGRADPFDTSAPYPEPYVPRSLTFEIPERIGAGGRVILPLDESAAVDTIRKLADLGIEAVAVCLLWSIANPKHEVRLGELLRIHFPGVHFTLSHELNPALREYRRASSTCIDASLKPLMTRYLDTLASRLGEAGFRGRLLMLTSQGGMMDAGELARAPIHVINSGPSLAPVAGRHYATVARDGSDIVVADTGGTTYDVSLVRDGSIPLTRDTWIGRPGLGHITGFPSVEVRSVGAGGGSIAMVDEGGVLHVGPASAGAVPGPACYGKGGYEPTLTDACLVLGYLDASYFLGGTMRLRREAAALAIQERVATPLGCGVDAAAAAILSVATENMVQAIADITISQGIDPAKAILLGGGGAAGFNSVFIARRLGMRTVVFPEVGAALSAAGALMSELASDHRATSMMSTAAPDFRLANDVLAGLEARGQAFLHGSATPAADRRVTMSAEARYEHQVWEIEVPLPVRRFSGSDDLDAFVEAFHAAHERIFSFRDPASPVEIIGWTARATARLAGRDVGRLAPAEGRAGRGRQREIFLPGRGRVLAETSHFDALQPGEVRRGPAIVETPFTTIVVDADCSYRRNDGGSLVLDLDERLTGSAR